MSKQSKIEQPSNYIEEAVDEILGRCLQGTLAFRRRYGYGIEGPPKD